MNRKHAAILVCTLIVLGGTPVGSGQVQSSPNTLKLEAPDKMPRATIQDVAWLTGHWAGEGLGGITDEVWAPPLGNTMVGTFRLVKDSKIVFYEFIIIVEENHSLVLKLKHFTPEFVGWEEKDGSVKFPLVKVTPTEAYFNGLTYRKTDDGSLKIFLVLKDRKTGKAREEEFLLKRK